MAPLGSTSHRRVFFHTLTLISHRPHCYVNTPSRDNKDIVVTALVGDGSVIPPFVVTRSKTIPLGTISSEETNAHIEVMPATKGESAALVVRWLEWARASGYLVEQDVIVCDNGPGFRSDDFRLHVEAARLCLLHFPSLLGALLNPCDNSFHAEFKLKLHGLMAKEGRFKTPAKLRLAIKAYEATKESAVRNYMHLTGLTGGDPEKVVDRLLESCLASSPRLNAGWTKQQLACVELFESWQLLRQQLRDPPQQPTDLPGSALDGVYWRSFSLQEK